MSTEVFSRLNTTVDKEKTGNFRWRIPAEVAAFRVKTRPTVSIAVLVQVGLAEQASVQMCGRCAKEGMFIPKKKKPRAPPISDESQSTTGLIDTPVLNAVLLALQMSPDEAGKILTKPDQQDDVIDSSSQTTTTKD